MFLSKDFFINFTLSKFKTMKYIYLLILATAIFSNVSAQAVHSPARVNLDPDSYVDVNFDGNYNSRDGDYLKDDVMEQSGIECIIFQHYKIVWVFNDVGNHNSNRVIEPGIENKKSDAVSN